MEEHCTLLAPLMAIEENLIEFPLFAIVRDAGFFLVQWKILFPCIEDIGRIARAKQNIVRVCVLLKPIL
jgi:hypothetical protein